jgi:hypothetical protein
MRSLIELAKSKGIDHINNMLENIGENEVLLALILATAKEDVMK